MKELTDFPFPLLFLNFPETETDRGYFFWWNYFFSMNSSAMYVWAVSPVKFIFHLIFTVTITPSSNFRWLRLINHSIQYRTPLSG